MLRPFLVMLMEQHQVESGRRQFRKPTRRPAQVGYHSRKDKLADPQDKTALKNLKSKAKKAVREAKQKR